MPREYREDEVPLGDLSPTSRSRLPPGVNNGMENNNGRGPGGRPGLGRRVSKNVMISNDQLDKMNKNIERNAKENLEPKFAALPMEKLKRIDYVIVSHKMSAEELAKEDGEKKQKKRMEFRIKFRAALEQEGVQIQEEEINELKYLKVHVPFWRLCKEAERMKLEMPLDGVSFSLLCHLRMIFSF